MTRVDVIVPCYNYGEMLEECARSVLSQEAVDVRVLIMDDASSDCTEEVGRRLAASDARVVYRRHATNCGHIATYNEALADISGDYCVILSADDMLTPGSLMRATRLMTAHATVGLVYGRDIAFRHTAPVAAARHAQRCSPRIMSYGEFLERACRLGHTGIQSPTAVVRTALHREIGGYLPELPHSGDTEIWLRMAAHADVCELDADQAFKRQHTRNMSLDYSPVRRLEEQKKAFDIHFSAYRGTRPEVARFEPLLARTLAESGLWSGARAFDAGDLALCDEFLTFAAAVDPAIRSAVAWRHLAWKRRLGFSVWRRIEPLAAMVRNVVDARVGVSARNVADE